MGPKKEHPITAGPAKAKFTVAAETAGLLAALAAPPSGVHHPPPSSTAPVTPPPAMSQVTSPVIAMDTSAQTGSMEDYLNRLINTTMTANAISTGTPDLVFHIKCEIEDHKISEDMQKGYHIIQGHDFIRKSVFQVNELSEQRITRSGCGYVGCTSTIEDALFQLSGPILCYKCRSTNSFVEMTEGCEIHDDTKLTTLIFNALSSVSNFYYLECKKLMAKSVTLPHTILLNGLLPNGQNQTSTFPCTIEQALSLYPWVQTKCVDLLAQLMDGRHFSQLTGLLGLLSQSKAPVPAESCSTPRSDNDNYFLVECQTLKNRERDIQSQNFKLKRGKRMSEEMVLHQDSFKRRKLDKVGNHSKFDTGRKKYESDVETGGLGTGFSDLCILQPLYTVNASVNIAPHYLMSSDTHKRDYTATRSYDDSLRCLSCTGKRKLHRVLEKGKTLFLFISDQHAPAVIPPLDEHCITSVRMSDMSLMDLAIHTVWAIANEWSKKPQKSAVSLDEFGACTLLQMALSRGTKVVLFFASGSGLTLEGPQGQTFAMARIMQLCCAMCFKQGESSLISRVIFPQPLIPSIERPDITLGPEVNIPKYEMESANAARLLCLNSSTADRKLATFISSTETVGMDYNLICKDPIRQALPFSCMTKLRGVPSTTQTVCITKTHLPHKMSWPSGDRSHLGALTLKTLGQYCAALHVDVLHALNDTHYPQPQVAKLTQLRTPFQNLQSTVQRWNDEILNCVGDTRLCVNYVKHREVEIFTNKTAHERHTMACYGHVAVKSAPPVAVVNLSLEDELAEVVGSGRGRGRTVPISD